MPPAALLLFAAGAAAVDSIGLRLGDVLGDGWRAAGLELTLGLDSGGRPAGTLHVDRLTLDPPLGTIRDVRLECPRLRITTRAVSCPAGRLRLSHPMVGVPDPAASFRYEFDRGALSLDLRQLAVTFSSADGTQAAEDLRLGVRLDLVPDGDEWRFDVTLTAAGGQAYSDPVFVDFGEHPATVRARGRLTSQALRVAHFDIEQPNVVAANGDLRLRRADFTLTGLHMREIDARLPAAYDYYLQPFLIGTPFDSLRTEGRLTGELAIDDAGPSVVSVRSEGLAATDTEGRMRLDDAGVEVHWERAADIATVPRSQLTWSAAAVGPVELGGSALAWHSAGDEFRLAEPARVPLLGGALEVNELSASDLATDQPQLRLNAQLTPIRLADLGHALGWPAFGGTLSGRIPELTYRDGIVSLAGGLTARVFDGEVEIRRLQLEDPLGRRPRTSLDATARSLDLEAVTSAFSFGRIQGRLDADVSGLRMIGWEPVAFDAWLRTPEDDRSRHRISQRAIDNLASLGGGGAGVLSRGFFKLFEDFAYDRIGLGCRLNRGVCRMRGLGPAEDGGYYIVRGRWLPRIDIIGHNRDVSWRVLLAQLQSVTAAESPIVQ